MPYKSIEELPKQVTNNLPQHAQDIYKEAYNSAWDEYKDPKKRKDDSSREEVSHKVAWSAVKTTYKKNDNDNWVKK
jgi:cation transport regulator